MVWAFSTDIVYFRFASPQARKQVFCTASECHVMTLYQPASYNLCNILPVFVCSLVIIWLPQPHFSIFQLTWKKRLETKFIAYFDAIISHFHFRKLILWWFKCNCENIVSSFNDLLYQLDMFWRMVDFRTSHCKSSLFLYAWRENSCIRYVKTRAVYAVKSQTSLAPLSRFVVHALLLRMNNNVVDFRVMRTLCHRQWNWQSVNHIPGIHDNGPCDHGLWRLTLTAYCACCGL